MSGTRNAYDSLTRLLRDVEACVRDARTIVAVATPVLVMDNLHPAFDDVLDALRAGCRELRADLDLLTDEANQ